MVVVLYPKFRTPAWRPFRAFMFIAMGLSAVVPVLHGLQMYGFKQLENQIGLTWLVTQGVLYIFGAMLYAVCFLECFCWRKPNKEFRRVSLNASALVPSTSGEARIRSSTSLWFWPRQYTSLVY